MFRFTAILISFSVVFPLTAGTACAALDPGRKPKQPRSQETVRPPAAVEKFDGLIDPVSGMKFVMIKGGRFIMGDTFNEGDSDETPAHEVQVADFALGVFAVTKGQFRRFITSTGYRTDAEKDDTGCYVEKGDVWNYDPATSWRNSGFYQDDSHPVVCVSWNDATAFAEWLTKKSGRRYRLPTEAEWEYAARSGGRNERFAGFSDPLQFYRYGNFCDKNCSAEWRTVDQNDTFKYTSPVGSLLPNGLGVYDMIGNVWQWVSDYYGEHYYRESTRKWPLDSLYGGELRRERAHTNPQGAAEGRYRTLRGGSWNSAPIDARAAQRLRNMPAFRRSYIGFRLVTSPERTN
jgi:formylglycine-generating enzyme